MKLGDKVLIVLIIVLTILFSLYYYLTKNNSDSLEVVIKQNGKLVKKIILTDKTDYEELFEWQGHINKVIIKDGTVRIAESNCRDKLCEKQGSIERPGSSIICLPNRFVVEINKKSGNQIDYIIK